MSLPWLKRDLNNQQYIDTTKLSSIEDAYDFRTLQKALDDLKDQIKQDSGFCYLKLNNKTERITVKELKRRINKLNREIRNAPWWSKEFEYYKERAQSLADAYLNFLNNQIDSTLNRENAEYTQMATNMQEITNWYFLTYHINLVKYELSRQEWQYLTWLKEWLTLSDRSQSFEDYCKDQWYELQVEYIVSLIEKYPILKQWINLEKIINSNNSTIQKNNKSEMYVYWEVMIPSENPNWSIDNIQKNCDPKNFWSINNYIHSWINQAWQKWYLNAKWVEIAHTAMNIANLALIGIWLWKSLKWLFTWDSDTLWKWIAMMWWWYAINYVNIGWMLWWLKNLWKEAIDNAKDVIEKWNKNLEIYYDACSLTVFEWKKLWEWATLWAFEFDNNWNIVWLNYDVIKQNIENSTLSDEEKEAKLTALENLKKLIKEKPDYLTEYMNSRWLNQQILTWDLANVDISQVIEEKTNDSLTKDEALKKTKILTRNQQLEWIDSTQKQELINYAMEMYNDWMYDLNFDVIDWEIYIRAWAYPRVKLDLTNRRIVYWNWNTFPWSDALWLNDTKSLLYLAYKTSIAMNLAWSGTWKFEYRTVSVHWIDNIYYTNWHTDLKLNLWKYEKYAPHLNDVWDDDKNIQAYVKYLNAIKDKWNPYWNLVSDNTVEDNDNSQSNWTQQVEVVDNWWSNEVVNNTTNNIEFNELDRPLALQPWMDFYTIENWEYAWTWIVEMPKNIKANLKSWNQILTNPNDYLQITWWFSSKTNPPKPLIIENGFYKWPASGDDSFEDIKGKKWTFVWVKQDWSMKLINSKDLTLNNGIIKYNWQTVTGFFTNRLVDNKIATWIRSFNRLPYRVMAQTTDWKILIIDTTKDQTLSSLADDLVNKTWWWHDIQRAVVVDSNVDYAEKAQLYWATWEPVVPPISQNSFISNPTNWNPTNVLTFYK